MSTSADSVTGAETARPERVVGIIPARIGSSRFARKVLASETGRPLVVHVAQAAAEAACLDEVWLATDSREVADACAPFGVRSMLTRPDHANGTSRLAEAAERLQLADADIVVNVQGDEPEIEPGVIDAAVQALCGGEAPMATVGSPFAPDENPANPNIVKVLASREGRALYFTRALCPHPRDGVFAPGAGPLKHVGLYAYRRWFLRTYIGLDATPLEQTEKLEQLRVLEHGHAIAVAIRAAHHCGVDTEEQYRAFVTRWRAAHPG